jgi:BolA family transcriptional regulator, general stress-responsive regulator
VSLPSNDRVERIRQRITAALQPTSLEITDDSHMHVGHAGAAGGGGHYTVEIVSAAFAGKPLVRRHRLVYDAVGDMMAGDIHALAIRASVPSDG